MYLFALTVKLFPVTCEYIQGEKQFYYKAQQFYEDVPASEEGMMGDFVEISNVDLETSRRFLKRFVVSVTEKKYHSRFRLTTNLGFVMQKCKNNLKK